MPLLSLQASACDPLPIPAHVLLDLASHPTFQRTVLSRCFFVLSNGLRSLLSVDLSLSNSKTTNTPSKVLLILDLTLVAFVFSSFILI